MFHCARSVIPALFVSTALSWGISSQPASAAPAETAPESLVSTIEQIEAAANAQDIEQVMALYSSNFQGPDTFTREQYQETLSQFWAQYTTLSYEVDLLSWEADGDAFIAETLTTVQGLKQNSGRDFTLVAEVRSRQRFENGQVVSQEILAEESHLESGTTPPAVTIRLPESVSPGESFAFDAIVEEPLGDRLLVGRALDEGVTSEDFLSPRPFDLEQLTAGGLFKIGQAPDKADQRWISSVLIREDGIVVDTRRLRVGE
ncbi:MAG: nuclear transport factor 2 family protein [Leptolyngbya sp. SIO1E4]|nr:nuclear transport factor 2 family protein [Leptolyngbya sp. SIO1E4]